MVLAIVVTSRTSCHSYNRVGNITVKSPETCSLSLVKVCIFTCCIVHREDRIGNEHVVNIVPIVVSDTDTALCIVGVSHVLTESDDVEIILAKDHMVRVDTYSCTVVLRLYRITEDTFLRSV